MKNTYLNDVLKKYEHKRFLAHQKLDFKKRELYSKNTRLEEIESELSTHAINTLN